VCFVCSIFVSSSAVGLKPLQDANKLLDRQKKVLIVSGLMEDGAKLTPEEVGSLFDARIKSVVVDLASGKVNEAADSASFDQLKAQKDPATSKAVEKNRAGVARVPNQGMVFLVSGAAMGEGGSGFVLDQYIFPVEGKGLWSTLYGYVAMAADCNQIKGLTFYAHGETPGLGGEVDNPRWKGKWPGKLAFADLGSDPASWGEAKIAVVKTGGDGKHKVDAISGATITSNGVTHLLRFWLGEHGFGPYIKRVAARPAQG